MSWRSEYHRKLTGIPDALAPVRSGNRVYISGTAATPAALLNALAARTDLENVEVIDLLALLSRGPYTEQVATGRFRHNSIFAGPVSRAAVNSGKADYMPVHLHRVAELFTQGVLPVDVALLMVSPPDNRGYMSMGVTVMASRAAFAVARYRVVQVNSRMPRCLGDTFIHVSEVDSIVKCDEELPELPPEPPTELERQIARYIADLIPDGATLQLGIGGLPDAVLSCLQGRADLGVHTEMVSDGVMKAMEAGLITGARKTLHRGKAVASFVLGSRQLYEYVHDNPAFEFHPASYTNDPYVIAQHHNLVAINSAVAVDLTGQVCADSIGSTIYSGFGGQVDFMRGASRSPGGKAIIALPSTTRQGTISRIVNHLSVGAGVVTTRADVDYVVTEYGVARLFGRNIRQRAEALINIAHPDFRAELAQAAWEQKLLPRSYNIGIPRA